MTLSKAEKLTMCVGCRDNYYNGQGAPECWLLARAKVVTRFRIGWWTRPTEPGAFTKVRTLNCHSAPGQYAHYESLPVFVDLEQVNDATANESRS